MKRLMVRYKVKADRAAENERYITAVYEQLARERPSGLRYATFKLDDGVSFVHIASHEGTDGTNPLAELSAFKAFTDQIRDRCDEPPVAVELHDVGSYEFFGPGNPPCAKTHQRSWRDLQPVVDSPSPARGRGGGGVRGVFRPPLHHNGNG